MKNSRFSVRLVARIGVVTDVGLLVCLVGSKLSNMDWIETYTRSQLSELMEVC